MHNHPLMHLARKELIWLNRLNLVARHSVWLKVPSNLAVAARRLRLPHLGFAEFIWSTLGFTFADADEAVRASSCGVPEWTAETPR